MRASYNRGADRYHLVHHVISRLRDRGWFSSRQLTNAVYHGKPRPHPQQHKRIREMLGRYVQAGILERDVHIAACALYRHTHGSVEDVDEDTVIEFEAHACRRWSRMEDLWLRLLEVDMDKLIPRNSAPASFTRDGSLLPSPRLKRLRDEWGRYSEPGPPSALAYVRKAAP